MPPPPFHLPTSPPPHLPTLRPPHLNRARQPFTALLTPLKERVNKVRERRRVPLRQNAPRHTHPEVINQPLVQFPLRQRRRRRQALGNHLVPDPQPRSVPTLLHGSSILSPRERSSPRRGVRAPSSTPSTQPHALQTPFVSTPSSSLIAHRSSLHVRHIRHPLSHKPSHRKPRDAPVVPLLHVSPRPLPLPRPRPQRTPNLGPPGQDGAGAARLGE